MAGSPSLDRSTFGELAAGELAAGELAAGELAAGELAAGELAAGELAGGELAARGECRVGVLPACRDSGIRNLLGDALVITEIEVERGFRKLLKSAPLSGEVLKQAEAMLEQLRPESPLRHRLAQEVDELRDLSQA